MSSRLCAAARGLGRRLGDAAQHQQRRSAGDLPVKPNKFVEANGFHRENVERDFRWNARTLTNIALAGVLFPYFIFKFRCARPLACAPCWQP
jgi:hypothetical protein